MVGFAVGATLGIWAAAWKADALTDREVTESLWWGAKLICGVILGYSVIVKALWLARERRALQKRTLIRLQKKDDKELGNG
jgi:hypothetical protein